MMDIGPGIGFGIFGLLFGVIYLGILALSMYLIISTIQFFKRKVQYQTSLPWQIR